MYLRKLTFLFGVILCVNLHAQDVPDVAKFLPDPPVDGSDLFICDNYLYTDGKAQRTTERGEQAKNDIVWELNDFIPFFSNIMGIPSSAMISSNIYQLLYYGVTYGDMALQEALATYYRIRPYAYFNEASLVPEYEEEYRTKNGYPAWQSTIGWLCALLLTEVCPELQDYILDRGEEFGLSTVISGYNWDSDAYAGFLLASAILSRLHTHSGFNLMVTYAQNDYKKLAKSRTRFDDTPYLDSDERPNPVIYLPEPPATNTAKYTYDLAKYQEGKSLRNTRTGVQAVADVEYSADNFCKIYSKVLGVTISASKTPAIYELVSRVHPSGNAATQLAKAYYMRPRPYVQMQEPTSYPADENHLRDTGSYPSGHASGSWLIALVLSEVAQTKQDELLARAYQFGQGRVITGYHWQTDVDYGRLVGSAVYARLHADKAFLSQMEKAVKEFKTVTSISPVSVTDTETSEPYYTLEGLRLNNAPTHPGIYIRNHHKIIIK